MKYSTLSMAIAATFVPFCAMAQEDVSPVSSLEPIVVTASRTAEPLQRALGDVTIVDGVQLRQDGASTIVDILKKQSGIQTYNSGGSQTASGVFVRGVSEKQSLMMIDGIRINDTFNGGAYWAAINPSTFNRLEIVRGAASSLYGSNAMGGVINLISSNAAQAEQGTRFFGGIGVGSYGSFRTYAGVEGAQGNVDYRLAGSFATSSGFNATTKASGNTYNADDDGYDQATINGAIGYRWAEGQHIGISFFNGYSHNEFDSGSLTNDVYDVTRQQVYTITSSNQLTDWWHSTLRFGFSKNHYYTVPTASAYYTNPEYTASSYQRQLTWQNNFTINQNNTITALVERQIESGVASNYAPTKSHRSTNSFGLIYQGHFNRHHIQASVRNDNFSDYGNRVTGSLAYDFDITPNLSIGLAGNTGFRAPTFQEQFGTFNGNRDLSPEKSRNVEAHITYQDGSTTLKATVFHNRITDLISARTVNGRSQLFNVNKATMKGVSLFAEHDFGSTQIYAGADFLSAKDNTTDTRLVRRAKAVYRAGITQQINSYELGVDYMFVGNRMDNDYSTFPASKVRLGGYGIVNARVAVQVNKQLSAQLNVNNVFDKKYTPAYGYSGQGTNFFLNLAYQH